MKLLIFCVFFLSFSTVICQTKLYPKDETLQDKGLSAFEVRLRSVIIENDSTSLINLLDEDILNGFGGSGGVEEFRQYWSLPEGAMKLWSTLTELLDLGGTINRDPDSGEIVGATWPYTFTRFPDHLDAYNYRVVTGNGVALRKRPSINSKIIDRLSYDILEFDYELTYENEANPFEGDFESVEWIALKYKGQIGYMSAQYVRSPIDYRMSVFKTDKGWRITMLIAGD